MANRKRNYFIKSHNKKSKRGVSDIIGNILILSITVTLFSTLFYWVGTLPAPTPSVSTQFTANIITKGNTISQIQITDLGGSPLYNSSTIIYISYQLSPQYNHNYYISSGLSNNPNYNGVWLPGMVWIINTNVPTSVNGNPQVVTISIVDVSKNQLVWSNQYPLSTANLPPIINSEGTIPNMPISWENPFQVWASVYEPQSGVTISSVTLSIPSFGVNQYMTFDPTHFIWVSSSITTYPATYISTTSAWITATNSNAQKSTIILSVNFNPPPPPPPQQTPNLWISEIAMYNGNGQSSGPFGGYGSQENSVKLVITNGGNGVAYSVSIYVYYWTYATQQDWISTEEGSYCQENYGWFGWWNIWAYGFNNFASNSISTVSFNWYPFSWNGWVNWQNFYYIVITYYSQYGNYYYYTWGGAFVAWGPGSWC
ncbi:MAG: type IV pilin [Thermoplasmata archaeon]